MAPLNTVPLNTVPFTDVQRDVLAAANRVVARNVVATLFDCLGSVLAEDIVASVDLPPFDNSAMDGFALRSNDVKNAQEDVPTRLQVIGEVAAGEVANAEVGAGQALRIMTGAPIPVGADAVVMVELTKSVSAAVQAREGLDAGEAIEISDPVLLGANIRLAGQDVHRGDVVLSAGHEITPGTLALLASIGVDEARVLAPPRVGVISTGNELGESSNSESKIVDSNRVMLLAQLKALGFEAEDCGWVGDDYNDLVQAFGRATHTCDVVISTGGVSVGDYDFTAEAIRHLIEKEPDGRLETYKIAMKPGKPLAVGLSTTKMFFGLPGNPASAFTGLELFVGPVLRGLAGHRKIFRPLRRRVAGEDFVRRADGKCHVLRAKLEGDAVVSAGRQQSNMLTSLAVANALVFLPNGEGVKAGEEILCTELAAGPSWRADEFFSVVEGLASNYESLDSRSGCC